MPHAGWIIRDLNDPDDRPSLRDFYERAQDYIILETGLAPSDKTIDELFQNAPLGAILRSVFGWDYLMIGVQSKGYLNEVLDTPTPIAATSDYSSCRLNCADQGMGPSCLNA
jgi:hypothetical protein